MRKVLLLALCVAASVVAQGQPPVNNSWTKSQTGILPIEDVNNSNVKMINRFFIDIIMCFGYEYILPQSTRST